MTQSTVPFAALAAQDIGQENPVINASKRVDTLSNTFQCQGSAKKAIENIPDSVPVRFVGQEVGEDVWTGGSLWSYCKSYDSLKNPCFRALFDWESHTGNTSTLSWDPITVTAAAGSVITVG